MQVQTIQPTLQGVKIENYQAVFFNKEVLKTVDLEIFTPKRVHYLVNALVHNTKLPSEQAMIRSEKRNLQKSGADKADQAVGRMPRIQVRPRRGFYIPNRYGRARPVRNKRGRRGPRQLRVPVQPANLPPLSQPINFPSVSQPLVLPNLPLGPNGLPIFQNPPPMGFPLNAISILPNPSPFANQPIPAQFQGLNEPIEPQKIAPQKKQKINKREVVEKKIPEIARKLKARVQLKSKSSAFKTHDPEWIVLKAYKAQIAQTIQKYREEIKKDKEPIISENLKDPLPLYFQKKKANQKRRRQQKHELIKKNRKALVEIFGDAIFLRGWPISRKQIKEALGIVEEASMAAENVAEFLGMVEGNQPQPMSVENESSQPPISEEVSQ